MEWTKDLLHEAFKMYRKLPPLETLKGEVEMYESTAKMGKKRFSEFLAKSWPNLDAAFKIVLLLIFA